MVEILLDTKFWNKVYKLLKPATVEAIQKNKGSGKDKLIPSVGHIKLHATSIDAGFLYKYIARYNAGKRLTSVSMMRVAHAPSSSAAAGLTRARIKEIEKAICHSLVSETLLPESVMYDGKPVIKQARKTKISTESFGFVYLVRNDEIYKIGITDNLLRRMKELKPDEIINVVRCINYKELEKRLHSNFKRNRIPQTEYFRLEQDEISLVNELMIEMAQFKV